MGITRRLPWFPVAAMLLAGIAAAADQSAEADHDVTISTQHFDPTLPDIPPDKFTDCTKKGPGGGSGSFDLIQSAICQHELNGEKRIVINACLNRDGKATPSRAIQACTELLDRQISKGATDSGSLRAGPRRI